MFKDEILKNERRSKIYHCVKKNPGLHLRGLQRCLDIPLTSLQYHLNYMVAKKIMFEEKSESHTRYFCQILDPKDREILSFLRQKRLREIVLITLSTQKANSQLMAETLELSPSTISFYLRYLVKHDVLQETKIGYENIYTLKDEARIEKVLIAYQETLLDKMVDKWANTWLERYLAKDKQSKKDPGN